MNKVRNLLYMIGMMLGVLLLTASVGMQAQASAPTINNITVYVECNGGTYLTAGHPDMNFFDAEFVVPEGSTISSVDHTIIEDSPTAIGKDFLGWDVYGASGNKVGSLWSAGQVNNYTITETTSFVAQWKDKEPVYTADDIYFLLWDHNKDTVDYTAKVSIVYDDVKYSGYGFVRIPEDICSNWKRDFEVIVEGNGHYIRANRQWVTYMSSTYSMRDYRHMNNLSNQMSETPSGGDSSPVRKSINEFIYSVRNVDPEITVLNNITTEVVPIHVDTTGSSLPEDMIVRAEKYVSGTQLDEIGALIKNTVGGEIKAVYDIEIADNSGNVIHDVGANVKADIDLLADYQLPEEKQMVVYYVSEDGKLEACNTMLHKKDDGTQYLTFETNHFSVYALAEVDKPKPTPEPTAEPTPEPTKEPEIVATPEPLASPAAGEDIAGDSENTSQNADGQDSTTELAAAETVSEFSTTWIWIGALAAVLLVAIGVVMMRKKK